MSIATLGRVFAAMESHRPDERPAYLTLAARALTEPLDVTERDAPEYVAANSDVDALLRALDWDTDPDSPGRHDLARALVALRRFAPGAVTDVAALRPYADAARTLADSEIPSTFDSDVDTDEALRFSVLGTVLFEPVLLALRKLAHVDRIRQLSTLRGGVPATAGPIARPMPPARRRASSG